MTGLPPATDDIARFVDLIGPEATLKLLEARGGTRLWIPERSEGSVLAEIVGLDAAAELYRKYGAGEIKLPIGRPWRVLCYIAMGMNRPQAALKAGTSEGVVHQILQRFGRPTAIQLDLFG